MKRPLTLKTKRALVNASFNLHAQGVQIPILKLTDIMNAGLAAIDAQTDIDDAVKTAIAAAIR